jgi:hypothetical protein
MSGRVIPTIGKSPIVILTFTAIWKNKILATQYAYTLLKALRCLSAMRTMRNKKYK